MPAGTGEDRQSDGAPLTHGLISARGWFLASRRTVGLTHAAPVPRAGPMAPNREAQVNRRSRVIRGRVPRRLAPMRVRGPCWPTRASSGNQISPGRPAPAGSRRGPARRSVFKSLLRRKVALRVQGTHRHAESQLLQPLADAALGPSNMEFGGAAVTQVGPAPAPPPSILRAGPSSPHFAPSHRGASVRRDRRPGRRRSASPSAHRRGSA